MKVVELAETLKREGYSPRWYSFDLSSPPFDGFILEKVGERWTVSYSERGYTRDIANFESESDACFFFLKNMQHEYGSVVGKSTH